MSASAGVQDGDRIRGWPTITGERGMVHAVPEMKAKTTLRTLVVR